MSTLAAIWWLLTNLPAIFRVLWKAETGRLYYFRDEAQKFVEDMASMPIGVDGVDRVVKEAREELKRRARRKAAALQREFYDQAQFRVWPDGTVQAVEDGAPYSHLSDDFSLVWAYDEEEALHKAQEVWRAA